MSELTDQEYNKLCAELMGCMFQVYRGRVYLVTHLCRIIPKRTIFNPATDANDTNKLIKKIKINTEYFYSSDRWKVRIPMTNIEARNKDRDTAIRHCIEAYLIEREK